MERSRYLNVILTVITVLLAAILWTSVAGTPLAASDAHAQSRTKPTRQSGFPVNSASQRSDMIKSLRDVKTSVDSMNKMLQNGSVKVYVTNISSARIDN